MNHDFYMKEALSVAALALEKGELPIGAVVVSGDRIIARSSTKDRELKRWLAHAELLALEDADQLRPYPGQRRETRLYTTLEPCLMCAGAALLAHVRRVVFGAWDPKAGAAGSQWDVIRDRRALAKVEVVGGVRAEESAQLLQHFFEEHRLND